MWCVVLWTICLPSNLQLAALMQSCGHRFVYHRFTVTVFSFHPIIISISLLHFTILSPHKQGSHMFVFEINNDKRCHSSLNFPVLLSYGSRYLYLKLWSFFPPHRTLQTHSLPTASSMQTALTGNGRGRITWPCSPTAKCPCRKERGSSHLKLRSDLLTSIWVMSTLSASILPFLAWKFFCLLYIYILY